METKSVTRPGRALLVSRRESITRRQAAILEKLVHEKVVADERDEFFEVMPKLTRREARVLISNMRSGRFWG